MELTSTYYQRPPRSPSGKVKVPQTANHPLQYLQKKLGCLGAMLRRRGLLTGTTFPRNTAGILKGFILFRSPKKNAD